MHDAPRTVAQVLRAFDRAIGLDVTPVSSAPAVTGAPASPPLDAIRGTQSGRPHETLEVRPAEGQGAGRKAAADTVSLLGQWVLPAEWLTDPQTREGRQSRLDAIRTVHDASCPHCTTATAHRQTVFGEGNPAAEVLFIGEAPGETEDEVGRPFVGRAGQKLDEMIRAMGLRREDVYIANALKSRPPDNRTPLQHEVDACGPYLMAQILAIRPRVIVTLGGPSTKLVLNEATGITRLRGLWRTWAPPEGAGLAPIPVMPTYHPAYVLRNYTAKVRGEVWSDLKAVLEALGRSSQGGAA